MIDEHYGQGSTYCTRRNVKDSTQVLIDRNCWEHALYSVCTCLVGLSGLNRCVNVSW